jgi:hypothetical protein
MLTLAMLPVAALPGGAAAATETVNLYFVALEDNGVSGTKIGCGDSLVPVRTEISSGTTETKIRAELGKLFAIHDQHYGQSGLCNALYRTNLAVESVSIDRGTATVRLTGSLTLGGVCDDPRAEAQIKQTVKQFGGITDVMVLLNGNFIFQAPGTRYFPETGHLAPRLLDSERWAGRIWLPADERVPGERPDGSVL